MNGVRAEEDTGHQERRLSCQAGLTRGWVMGLISLWGTAIRVLSAIRLDGPQHSAAHTGFSSPHLREGDGVGTALTAGKARGPWSITK